MSVYAVEWAVESAPTANIYEGMILSTLAARADHDGCGAFPSTDTLARACHCDPKTVTRYLQALLKRKLIGPGDPRRAAHIPANHRPNVYDILIPFEWFSKQQLETINRKRAESGFPALAERERPPIESAPARTKRSDAGVPRPHRKKKPSPADSPQGGLRVPPAEPVDNPLGGTESPLSGGTESPLSGGTESPPTPSVSNSVLFHSVRPEVAAGEISDDADPVATDGRTDGEISSPETTDRPRLTPVAAAPELAAELVADPALQLDFERIDLKPAQRKRLVAAVDQELLRFPAVQVAGFLVAKAREARTATWLLTAFAQYSDSIKLVPMPAAAVTRRADLALLADLDATTDAAGPDVPWCGACESPQRRRVSTMVMVDTPRGMTETERITPCPLCGPQSAAATATAQDHKAG